MLLIMAGDRAAISGVTGAPARLWHRTPLFSLLSLSLSSFFRVQPR